MSHAASMPYRSTTDGVNGNFSPSIHCSFQSSIDRNELRGAAGFALITRQASSLTLISDMPGGPARHFCAPATQMSSIHSSGKIGMPPNDDTQSTNVRQPCAFAIGPISATGFSVPEGVSEWTTLTNSISGCSVR